MDLNEKRSLLVDYFQSLIIIAKANNKTFFKSNRKEKDKAYQRYEETEKAILTHIKPHELSGLIFSAYDELFYPNRCRIFKFPSLNDKRVEFGTYGYQEYIYDESTGKAHYNPGGQLEEVRISDPSKFKNDLAAITGNDVETNLRQEQIKKLFTENGGHKPERLINQVEARRIVSGSSHLIHKMQAKELTHSKRLALGLSILSCFTIVTIPFVYYIYQGFLGHFQNKQIFNSALGSKALSTKLYNRSVAANKYPFFPLIMDRYHIYENTDDIEILAERSNRQKLSPDYRSSYWDPYLKRDDLFNKHGELRKEDSEYPDCKYDRESGQSEGIILGTNEQIKRHLNRQSFFGARKINVEASKQKSEQNIKRITKRSY